VKVYVTPPVVIVNCSVLLTVLILGATVISNLAYEVPLFVDGVIQLGKPEAVQEPVLYGPT
jgi:hypothetical protein